MRTGKEMKEEIAHVLYDQTRRTPIVITVINEVGPAQSQQRPPIDQVKQPQKPVVVEKPYETQSVGVDPEFRPLNRFDRREY